MNKNTKSVCEQKNYKFLFDTYSKGLYNFIYYKCGDTQQAEDVVQEAYIKLWNNCSKVAFEKAKSFLFTVARNLFLNDVAHKKIVLQHQLDSIPKVSIETPQFLLE